MLFSCGYTRRHRAIAEQVRQRFERWHGAGTKDPERFGGYDGPAGGGAGCILAEVDDHRDPPPMLQPHTGLMGWDVRAIFPIDHDRVIGGAPGD